MSVIRKKPFIESVIESLTDEQKASLLSVMNGSENTVNASFTDLPEDDVAPVLFQLEPNNLKTGILIQTETYNILLAYHRFQDMQIYKLDLSKFTFEKINEYLDINELRRTVSGGESGTEVVANPTLAGTESSLTGLQVGDTKYAVGGGTKLYKHTIASTNLKERIDNIRFSIVDNDIVLTLNAGAWKPHYTDVIVVSKTATLYTSVEDVVKDIENILKISTNSGQQTLIANYVGGYIGSTSTYFLQFFTPTSYNISYKYVTSWTYVKSDGALTDTVVEL